MFAVTARVPIGRRSAIREHTVHARTLDTAMAIARDMRRAGGVVEIYQIDDAGAAARVARLRSRKTEAKWPAANSTDRKANYSAG